MVPRNDVGFAVEGDAHAVPDQRDVQDPDVFHHLAWARSSPNVDGS